MLLQKERDLVTDLTHKLEDCEKRLSESKDSSVKDVEARLQAEINKIMAKNDKLK
jgi:hypothetical protein